MRRKSERERERETRLSEAGSDLRPRLPVLRFSQVSPSRAGLAIAAHLACPQSFNFQHGGGALPLASPRLASPFALPPLLQPGPARSLSSSALDLSQATGHPFAQARWRRSANDLHHLLRSLAPVPAPLPRPLLARLASLVSLGLANAARRSKAKVSGREFGLLRSAQGRRG